MQDGEGKARAGHGGRARAGPFLLLPPLRPRRRRRRCTRGGARPGAPLPSPSSSLLSSLVDLAGGVAAAHVVPRRDGGTRRRGPCQGVCAGRWQASSMVLETVSSCGAATRPRNASWVGGRLGKILSQGQNLRRQPPRRRKKRLLGRPTAGDAMRRVRVRVLVASVQPIF